MAVKKPTPVQFLRERLRVAVKESGLSQEEIGLRMGFKKGGARQAISRLLSAETSYDPRISTLYALAEALGKNLKEFI